MENEDVVIFLFRFFVRIFPYFKLNKSSRVVYIKKNKDIAQLRHW